MADQGERHKSFARPAQAPAPIDQPSRYSAGEEVAQIRSNERNPDRDQTAAELDSFRDEVYRKPIGHEEPDRVGKTSRNDHAPCLWKRQEAGPSTGVPCDGGVALVSSDDFELRL